MGMNDRKDDEKANKRAKAKEGRSRRAANGGQVDWREFGWTATAALTMALSDAGGAIRIGRTRDGGAWAIGIYLGDDYATEYIRPAEDFGEAIREIAEAWCPDGGEQYNNYLTSMTPKK